MIKATLYTKPHGQKQEIEVLYVNEEDADYLNSNSVKVSMEEILGDFVVYFDDGVLLEDNATPDEIFVFSKGRKCEDTIADGVSLLKKRKE